VDYIFEKTMRSTDSLICFIVLGIAIVSGIAMGQTRPLEDHPSPPPPPNDGKPTLWIVGDSTVKNGTRGEKGWGEVIGKYFDQSRIHVANHAIGGRSSRTFMTEGRWDKILAYCNPGDFVLIQIGHNDGGPINDNTRARGTIRGIGEETQEIDNQLTGKHEVVHTYGWYLRKYVQDSLATKMTPIICSPIPHVPKVTGKPGDLEQSDYVEFSQQIAEEQRTPFIQLNGLIMAKYAGMDPADIKSKYFTPADNTHTNPAGAELNAACVIEGISKNKDCEPLAKYLIAEAATQPTK
jgi:rhamnogalacturonan acetylesterase